VAVFGREELLEISFGRVATTALQGFGKSKNEADKVAFVWLRLFLILLS